MSRVYKRLIVVFCIGVFLCGIGAGIAFTEFSVLTYGGRKVFGDANLRTDNFDIEFEPGEGPVDISGGGLYAHGPGSPKGDASVPRNTVRFCATYNADRIEPYAYWQEEDERIIFSWVYFTRYDEMAVMMEAKDLVLQNLKEGRIISFDVPLLEDVEVLVNPANLDDVRIAY